MMMVHFELDLSALRALAKQVPGAIAAGMNEGGDPVRKDVRMALKAQTNVKSLASILSRTAASGIGPNRAAPARLVYAIVATGKGMPIREFPVTNTGQGISAATWGVAHLFKRSFEIKGRGVGGFRARLSTKRYPIRKLYGPALPKEIVKGQAAAVFYASTARHVPPAVLRQLAKALGA